MIHRNISQLALDEVVFESKNQVYGAYQLRQVYNSNLIRSVVIMLLFVTTMGVGYVALNLVNKGVFFTKLEPKILQEEVIIDLIDIPKPMVSIQQAPIPIATQPTVSRPIVSATNTNYKAVNTPTETLKKEAPADNTGILNGNAVPTAATGNVVLGVPVDVLPIETVETSIPVDYVPVMPEFKNLSKYLADHINYPNDMLNLGITGKVYIEFVVSKDGTVREAKILKSSGHNSLDAEALRVVAQMPNWSPGLSNGNPVAVRQKQCINFRIQD